MSPVSETSAAVDLELQLDGIAAGLEIIAARRLGSREDAEEATQETLSRLLVCIRTGRVSTAAEVAPIAYGIARHVIADILRRRARELQVDADAASLAPHALDVLVREEECRAVRAALQGLPSEDRALLHRCFVDGASIVAIADESGQPADRLRKRKSRALQRLAALLQRPNGRSGHDPWSSTRKRV